MISNDQLERSKAIQRRTGSTFHLATRFLPERARHPTYVCYAFFRTADDVVDDPEPGPPEQQRRRLHRLRESALGEREPDDPVLAAFDRVRRHYGIPDREVEAFVEAMEADVESAGYETFAELEEYLRGSAVAVAFMLLEVMDPEEKETARPHARALGEAFQLTNFLRDVREDVVDYGRVYLPRETLRRHGISEDDVAALRYSEGFAAAMGHELRRTEERYREGVAGIRLLPADCQFPVLLSAVLYAEYHRLIRERDSDVLSATPSLGYADYARLVARTWWHWRRERDPERVFYRVSAVPIAAGTESEVVGSESVVAGPESVEAGAESVAAGSESEVAGRESVADGSGSVMAGPEAVSAGSESGAAGTEPGAAGAASEEAESIRSDQSGSRAGSASTVGRLGRSVADYVRDRWPLGRPE